VDPAERLLDLVIALTHAERRMTRAEIRARVHGYSATTSPEAFERMFERDKDTLRDLGIPLVTDTHAAHGDEVGYRIDTEGYELPPIDLTPAEVGVLSLAAQLWADASLSEAANRGLTKLRAVSPAAEPDVTAGMALRLRGPEAVFETILDAITTRSAVAFTYRAASTGEVRRRVVEPWRLVSQRRAWYLLGLDRDRGAPRAFRLSRIEGRVRRSGGPDAFAVPADLDTASLLAGSAGEGGTARLAVLPDRAAALRARAGHPPAATTRSEVDGRDVLEVPYDDAEAFADDLAGYADAVVVLAPAALRAAVLRRLQAAARLAPPPLTGGDSP
jgi:proteasome accessory factor B